jgi:adenosylmethionine-8-amino-7-oxononanoate aminotransferase
VRDTSAGPEIGAIASRDLRDRHGLIVRAHESVLSLSPPLVIADDEADRVVAALQDTLTRIGEGL